MPQPKPTSSSPSTLIRSALRGTASVTKTQVLRRDRTDDADIVDPDKATIV